MTDYAAESNTINSLRDLQLLIPRLLKQVNADRSLALAAAANPLLLLDHLGYDVSESARQEIELRARFGNEGAAAYLKLKAFIFETLGQRVNIDDGSQLFKEIVSLLERTGCDLKTMLPGPRSQQFRQALEAVQQPELLQEFSDLHPVVPLLIQYRQLEKRHPCFASANIFNRILCNEVSLPITELKFNLQDRDRRQAGRLI